MTLRVQLRSQFIMNDCQIAAIKVFINSHLKSKYSPNQKEKKFFHAFIFPILLPTKKSPMT